MEEEIIEVLQNAMIPAQIIEQVNIRERLIGDIITDFLIINKPKKSDFFKEEILFKEFFTLSNKIKIFKRIIELTSSGKYQELKKSGKIRKLMRMMTLRNIIAHGMLVHGENLSDVTIYSAEPPISIKEIRKEFWEDIIPDVNELIEEVKKIIQNGDIL